jgi:transposase-like protein
MKQHDEKEMLALYNSWFTSGQSKKSFAEAHGLRSNTFHYWIKKFKNKNAAPAAPPAKGGFDRLSMGSPALVAKAQALAIINFPSGISVELHSPLDAGFLKTLVS